MTTSNGGPVMKAASLDTSVQRAHEWLHEIAGELGFDNERAAYAALRATLHAVRDRLPVGLVAHFGAEMPTIVRGVYYEGWHPSPERLRAAHNRDFAEALRAELAGHDELQDVGRVAGAVIRVIERRMAPGQLAHVVEALPRGARALWAAAQAAPG
jgi:uncharacterized protein (DUF2267 family)